MVTKPAPTRPQRYQTGLRTPQQRWLGHHKPSFTLDTYVHLLPEDVPEPTFFDALAGSGDKSADYTPANPTEATEAADVENPFTWPRRCAT